MILQILLYFGYKEGFCMCVANANIKRFILFFHNEHYSRIVAIIIIELIPKPYISNKQAVALVDGFSVYFCTLCVK